VVCSASENGWESTLNVAHVASNRRSWSRLGIVRRLELSLIFLAFNWHAAFKWLLRIFLVGRELSQSLVVTSLARVRWFERLVVDDKRSSLGLLRSLGDRRVFTQNLLVGVEGVSLFDLL